MTEVVRYALRDGVAILQIANPPVNALSLEVRRALLSAIARAADDEEAKAIVLTGAGQTFPAGADIREFDAPAQAPYLPEVCDAIEASTKPVVACLHGTALGGGYEVALAAHARLAVPGTKVGFPEVTLGVIPGAGGTQRLPRIVALDDAVKMMLYGVPVDVATAREKGFVDGIVEGDLVSAGVAHAKAMVGAPPTPTRNRRDRFTSALAFQNAIDTARAALGEAPTRAPAAILECVEAAPLLPFDQGLALERDLFLELRDTPEAKALRHAFLATREAVKPRPDLPAPSSVRRVAVVGGGQMGSAITVVCLDAELDVVLIEKPEERAAARERVTGIYDRAVSRGAMRETVRESRLERLTMGEAMDDVIHADLIIEAVPDDPDLKAQLFEALGSLAKPGAILASNTSYLDIDELAEASGRPEDVLGLHFFAPAHVQQAVEVVVGYQTSPSAEATAFAFAQKLRKKPVRAENSEGFIGNRILTAYRRAADYLLEDGASPYEIDAAMRAFGFKLGPYQVLDMTGLDISWARRQRHARAEDERYIRIGDALCEAGLLGRKVGQGYYAYDAEHPNGRENPAALTIIDAERAAKGVTPRRVRRAEMSRMCLLAMMNEGGRILDEGIAERAGDIDVVMLLGFGFPRHRGGPMKAAELSGLLPMLRELERLSQEDPFWMPSDALREAVKNGNRFSAVL